jgi:hypothetical protein
MPLARLVRGDLRRHSNEALIIARDVALQQRNDLS